MGGGFSLSLFQANIDLCCSRNSSFMKHACFGFSEELSVQLGSYTMVGIGRGGVQTGLSEEARVCQ